ncbi:hypothetical protein COY90_01200 [Candidatus Roizmanbacteria bacterium CG_4_10_14_0_8_um_filter_39_9]|uniref:HAD-IB family hydrolase n=1 Tax=Candidatus Roizmanbacteria bacterium CG_4_10_14_0_8_um_filter_39_9 TaxID=1974829 RepID=A0A2M7QEK1_9BACT|nr:MAG: hypothetical protein COY90_01200 [Candidatus Roizmanbacteria bacterium CG_4_10_14_0_8_um_filter_39_9]
MKTVAFFDLDKTLYDGYSVVDFFYQYILPNKLASNEILNLAQKLSADFNSKKISYNEATEKTVMLCAEVLKGRTIEIVSKWQEAFFQPSKLFPYVLELFRFLKEKKVEAYIISASIEPIVTHISNFIGVKSFSSEVEIIDNVYSGKVFNILNDRKKSTTIKDILDPKLKPISLGFGDSMGDVSLLDSVTYGLLFEPADASLIERAKRSDWRIVNRNSIFSEVTKIINGL